MTDLHQPGSRAARLGLTYGGAAVVFWSFGSTLVYIGARKAGTWTFVAIASTFAAILQMLSLRVQHRNLRTALFLPGKLWIGPVLCFVIYGLAWPLALASSSPSQVFGTNLINYLWPVLTVVLSVFLVPGVRLTGRTFLALCLALGGLIIANLQELSNLAATRPSPSGLNIAGLLPYLLSLVAAVTWAVYSALLARWRLWAQEYVTSPIGFLLIGVIAFMVLAAGHGHTTAVRSTSIAWMLLYGAGPLAAGYLFWELALVRTQVQTLGILAAGTPVLSTLLLCLFLRTTPRVEIILAAVLVSAGVLLSRHE